MVVDSAVQFVELLVAYRGLYPYGCGAKILRQFNGSTHTLDVDSLLVALSASPSCKLDYQTKANDVYLQFTVDTQQCLVALQITSSGVVVLPRIEFSLCLLAKGKDVGLQFVVLIKLTLLVYEPADDLLPFVFKFFGSLSIVPTALLNSFGHYEEYAVDKSIACSLAFT